MDIEHTVETIVLRVACELCGAVTWRAEIAPDEPCPGCGGERSSDFSWEIPAAAPVI